ncbi:unnamed protein product [Cochlearia groenlandica]
MASDSQTAFAITSEKPLESKVNEEAKLMEKEIVLSETADVVEDKPVSHPNLIVIEEKVDQTPAAEQEKESPAVVEHIAAVVKTEESTEKGKEEYGEKVDEQAELKEPTLLKEGVEEINLAPVDEEKVEEKGKDENGEKKVDEQVEVKEPILVKEVVEEEKAEEKKTENAVEEDNKDKEEIKVVDVSESADEAGVKQVEPVVVQTVRDVAAETVEDKTKDVEVEPNPEVSQKIDTQLEKAKDLGLEVEVVKTEEAPETTEETKVELEEKLADVILESGSAPCQDSDTVPKKETEKDVSSYVDVIEKAITEENHVVDEPSKEEKPSESDSAFCPDKVVSTNTEKETEGGVSSPAEVIEKAIPDEKHVVEEPSKEEKENVNGKSEEILKETVTETKGKESSESKQEEPITDVSPHVDVIEKAIAEEKHLVDEPSDDENPSKSDSALCPENVLPTHQVSDTSSEKEIEADFSSPADVTEKAISEKKHVTEEPSKGEKENVSEAKDVVTNLPTEDENIKKDSETSETPAADGKSEETPKETDKETKEKESSESKQEEPITEKVAEVLETQPVVEESNDEPKQEPEVTTKEVPVKQKNSNSIMSKVKQSLVKAKKAIIGKSPSSKTMITEEAKGETKA